MSQPSHVVSGKSHIGILMMLAWPAILEQLLLTLVRYVDTAMVARWEPTPPPRLPSMPLQPG